MLILKNYSDYIYRFHNVGNYSQKGMTVYDGKASCRNCIRSC